MKEIIVLLLTFAILAVQYHLGLMRKPGFGAVLPAALAALFLAVSFLEYRVQLGHYGFFQYVTFYQCYQFVQLK